MFCSRSRLLLLLSSALLAACSTHHWAEVKSVVGPPPPGSRHLHSSRLIVSVSEETGEVQCAKSERYRPVCFHNLRSALSQALSRNFWSSFPETEIGDPKKAGAEDYLLEVSLVLETLPPGPAGPGWSTGAKSHYRLTRGGHVLAEQTLASRSRADYAYGAPLGEGASDTLDAIAEHIVLHVSQVPELKPELPRPLPPVASRSIVASGGQRSPAATKPAPEIHSTLAVR